MTENMMIEENRSVSARHGVVKKCLVVFLLGLLMSLMIAGPASAAKKKNVWVLKDGYWYYYNKKGKKLTGFRKIGKKKYYFDNTGKQRVGWRYINGNYYRFNMGGGKKGYMLKNRTINRLYVDSNGKALLRTDLESRIARVMYYYTLWGDQITKPTWSAVEKRNAVIKAIAKFSYKAEDVPGFDTGWDVTLAEECYARYASGYNYYECERFAVAFAYLCKAVGLTGVVIHIGGELHGWVTAQGGNYDPTRYVTQGPDKFVLTSAMIAASSYYRSDLSVKL